MTETYGIPTWVSYGLFALATIAAGLLLGIVSKLCVIHRTLKTKG